MFGTNNSIFQADITIIPQMWLSDASDKDMWWKQDILQFNFLV